MNSDNREEAALLQVATRMKPLFSAENEERKGVRCQYRVIVSSSATGMEVQHHDNQYR